MDLTYDLKLSTAVEAAHPVWARPFSSGTIKAFFLPGVHFGREIVELIQRMDVEYENVTIDRITSLNKWGLGDFYHKRSNEIIYKNLELALTSDERFDVLVIPGINGWGHFTEKTRAAVIERVKRGEGLVMIQPFGGEAFDRVEILDELSPMKPLYKGGLTDSEDRNPELDKLVKERWIPQGHYITDGIPFELFPYDEMAFFPYETAGDVIIRSESGKPVAAVRQYGKGRVVAFGYYPRDILPQHSDFTGWDPCYEPVVANWHGARHKLPFNYLEYFYSLIIRSMIWAACKEPECRMTKAAACNGRVSVSLYRSGNYTLACNIKNYYDMSVFNREGSAADGIELPEYLQAGGNYRIDISLKCGDKILDWSTVPVVLPLKSKIKSVSASRDIVRAGDILAVAVDAEGSMGELEVSVLDDFGRIIYLRKQELKAGNKLMFEYTVQTMKSMHIRVQADIKIGGYLIHRMESEKIIITPEKRTFDDFQVFVCPQNRGQGDLSALENEKLHEMGSTGLYIGDNKLSTLSGAEGLGIAWYDRAPYVERKESYLRTKEKKYLHRIICMNDPEFWKENEKRIAETVGRNCRYGPVSYFANDEGSLTCYTDELELCFCPHCMKAMREWLKNEYRDLSELNRTWGTSFDEWDSAEPYTWLEAKKAGEFASWGDHRRFMEHTFANAYKNLRDYIRKTDPEGVVRMSGTQASTPYSGYDYYLLHQYIGYFEAYAGGNQYELHRSFANPGTTIGGWFGYGSSGITVHNQIWKAVCHGLTLMSIFWEYSCLNPDFTFSKSAVDMAVVFNEIKREGIGKLLLHSARRDSLGIALHYSMASVHGSYARENLKKFENNRQGWINILEDQGYQYDMIASQQIEAGRLMDKGYRLLILPYSIALSSGETAAIKCFVENGGIVIGDFQTGIMDEHNKLYDSGSLDDVFGIERLTTDTQPFYVDNEPVQTEDFPYFKLFLYDSSEFKFVESGTRAKTGKAGYVQDFSRTVAAVVINDYGKGKGIYLNFSLDRYPELRKQGDGGCRTGKLIKRILALTGVEKFAVLKTPDGKLIEKGYETVYYSDGSAEYAAVLRDLGGSARVGHDGLAVGNAKGMDETADNICIELRRKAHVYDIRRKSYLGFTDSVEVSIIQGDARLLSMLPYKVNSIDLQVCGRVKAGELFTFSVGVDSGKPENEYSNVLSINVYNPDGKHEWIYSDNVSITGSSLAKSLLIPYNEKPGMWRITAKDAASGVSAEKTFEVIA